MDANRKLDGGSFSLGGNHPPNGAVADSNRDVWPDKVIPDFATQNLSVLINTEALFP
jgi:hypothetical protein